MNKKKSLVIVVAALLVFAVLTACGNSGKDETAKPSKNATELVIGTMNSVEEYAEVTLFKVTTTDKVTASLGDDIHYNNDNPGEVYVDMIFDIKNISTTAIESNNFMSAKAVGVDGTEYVAGLYAIETNNSTYVSQYENLTPLTNYRFHCAFSVPETETALNITVNVNEKVYTYNYTVGNVERKATVLNTGDILTVEDFAVLTFKGIEYTDDLLPSNTSGSYRHYEVDSKDNTYLVVKYDIENLQSSAKDADSFVGVKASYMGKYTYTGFVVVEDDDQRGFSSYEQISPLAKRSCYCLIEVPKTVSENEVELDISFESKDYTFKG